MTKRKHSEPIRTKEDKENTSENMASLGVAAQSTGGVDLGLLWMQDLKSGSGHKV